MAKQQPNKQQQKAAASAPKQSVTNLPFLFDRSNYILMIAGVVIILVGFALMAGGATTDPNIFPKEEIYSFRRITLSPIVIMLGFGPEIFAIMKRPKASA